MNVTSKYEFTIIIPVFNEEGNMPRLADTISSYLPRCPYKACALFVDDGSTDGSGSLIEKACSEHDGFFYIRFASNAGLSAAIKAGFDFAESRYVGYMDADMQTSPEDFSLLLPHIVDCSMVTGVRSDRHDNIFKRMQSRIANGFRRMMTHDGAADTGCPLKVFRTECAKSIPMFKGMHRFFPALVLLQDGGSYMQIPVRHYHRLAGKSKFHLWNRLLGPLADCFAYRWMKTRYINYSVSRSNIVSGPECREQSN